MVKLKDEEIEKLYSTIYAVNRVPKNKTLIQDFDYAIYNSSKFSIWLLKIKYCRKYHIFECGHCRNSPKMGDQHVDLTKSGRSTKKA